MDTFFNILKKTLTATIFVIFAFVVTYVPQPFAERNTTNEAEAFLGGIVLDPTNLVQNTASAIADVWLKLKDIGLDAIAWTVAKNMVSLMVADLVEWIGSGFQGKPAFITDLRGFLLETADLTASDYINELGGPGSFLCSPFQLDIQIALSIEYEEVTREGRPIPECRISQFVTSLEDFIEGDFFAGGWESWFEITANPQTYTPYGQLLTAETALDNKIAEAEADAGKELDWGSGFLSGKVCNTVDGPNGPTTRCNITKPGATISASLSKALGAGQDTLVTADEINEIVAALIGTLANKAITGVNGLLGLSPGTGYTSPGYQGGSYASAVRAETAGNFDLQYTAKTLADSLQLHQDYSSLALLSGPKLLAYANDIRNDANLRELATSTYQDAQTIQVKTANLIPQIISLQTRFNVLETEYNSPATLDQRKNDIQIELMDILNEYNQLGAYTEAEYRASEANWRSIISQ